MALDSVKQKFAEGARDSIEMQKFQQELQDEVTGQQGKTKYHNNGTKAALDGIQ